MPKPSYFNVKRVAALAAATITGLSLQTGALPHAKAEDGTVTMAEYRETVPDSVQFTIDGQIYDVPITLPDEDTLPVIVTQMATFNTADIRKTYPLRTGLPSYVVEASTAYDYNGSYILCFDQEEAEGRLEGKTDYSTRTPLPEGSTPQENDVTVDEIMDFIRQNIRLFQCDMEPDLRVLNATAMSGLCRMKKVKASDGSGCFWTEYAADETRPVSGAEKGSWELQVAQYLHGAQIFGPYFPYSQYQSPAKTNEWYTRYDIFAHYMDEKNFNIIVCLAKEIGTVQRNATLLPFDEVVERIRRRIDEGALKSIYGLTLGYSVRIVKGDVFWNDQYDFDPECRFVLVPEWRILGYDVKDYNNTTYIGHAQPSREAVLDPEYYSAYGLIFELRLNAATGEPILDYEAMEYALPSE